MGGAGAGTNNNSRLPIYVTTQLAPANTSIAGGMENNINANFYQGSQSNQLIAPVNLKSLTSSLTKKESLDDKVEKALN